MFIVEQFLLDKLWHGFRAVPFLTFYLIKFMFTWQGAAVVAATLAMGAAVAQAPKSSKEVGFDSKNESYGRAMLNMTNPVNNYFTIGEMGTVELEPSNTNKPQAVIEQTGENQYAGIVAVPNAEAPVNFTAQKNEDKWNLAFNRDSMQLNMQADIKQEGKTSTMNFYDENGNKMFSQKSESKISEDAAGVAKMVEVAMGYFVVGK